jgi:hypothetical protein
VSSFDFGEKRVQTLAPKVFTFCQPGLEQTSEATSVAHTHCGLTVRTLVRSACDRGERISEAVKIHLSESQIAGARLCESLSGLLRTSSERTAKMAKFVLNIGGILHCVGHFIAQQPAVALPHAIK